VSEPFYVYIAGPLSDFPAQYLANVAAISRLSRELMEDGYCPINPAGDALEGLMSDVPLTILQYHVRSMHLLRLLKGHKRAALFVISDRHADGRESSGVAAEIESAEAWEISVVWTRARLDLLSRKS
jgi:hypothetical protein